MVFGEGATVFVEPDDPDPDHGGGPVRRGGPQTIRMQPPIDVMVYRTPHQVVREGEPGARWPGITRDKFLPDGRLVRQGALGNSGSAFGGTTSTLNPVEALNRVSNQYRTLRMQQGRIAATYKKIGAPIPCEVMSKFNAAVREYQIAGVKVLDAIRKALPDTQFFQVPVDMEGKPLLDSKGVSIRRTIDVPLHPGGFVLGPGCPGFSGSPFGLGQGGALGASWTTYAAAAGLVAVGVGLIIVAAPVAAVGAAAVAAGTLPTAGAAAAAVATAAGAASALVGVLKAVQIVWPDDSEKYVNEFTAWNEGRLACLDKAAARGVKGAAAISECGAAAGAPTPPSHGWGILAWIGLGTVVVGGVIAARYIYRRRRRLASGAAPSVPAYAAAAA